MQLLRLLLRDSISIMTADNNGCILHAGGGDTDAMCHFSLLIPNHSTLFVSFVSKIVLDVICFISSQ